MKRSEMVLRIATMITLGGIAPRGQKPEDNKVTANKILTLVEKLGMLPPERTYEDWTGMGTITETDNTWEPE